MYRDKFVNQINKHYWIGVFTGIGIGAIYFLVPPMIDIFIPSTKEQLNYKVIDTYKGCKIIEFTTSIGAKQNYFLDCGE